MIPYEDEDLDDVQALLQAFCIQDMSAEITDALREAGFERVGVTELSDLPEHVWEWLGEGWSETEFAAALQEVRDSDEEPRYWRIETAQGDFGLLWAGLPIVDLAGTGVEPFQLDTSLVPPCPKFCIIQDETAFEQLREIMEFDREIEMLSEEAEADDY